MTMIAAGWLLIVTSSLTSTSSHITYLFQLLTQWADRTITTIAPNNAAHVYEEMDIFDDSEQGDWLNSDEWLTTDSEGTEEWVVASLGVGVCESALD